MIDNFFPGRPWHTQNATNLGITYRCANEDKWASHIIAGYCNKRAANPHHIVPIISAINFHCVCAPLMLILDAINLEFNSWRVRFPSTCTCSTFRCQWIDNYWLTESVDNNVCGKLSQATSMLFIDGEQHSNSVELKDRRSHYWTTVRGCSGKANLNLRWPRTNCIRCSWL